METPLTPEEEEENKETQRTDEEARNSRSSRRIRRQQRTLFDRAIAGITPQRVRKASRRKPKSIQEEDGPERRDPPPPYSVTPISIPEGASYRQSIAIPSSSSDEENVLDCGFITAEGADLEEGASEPEEGAHSPNPQAQHHIQLEAREDKENLFLNSAGAAFPTTDVRVPVLPERNRTSLFGALPSISELVEPAFNFLSLGTVSQKRSADTSEYLAVDEGVETAEFKDGQSNDARASEQSNLVEGLVDDYYISRGAKPKTKSDGFLQRIEPFNPSAQKTASASTTKSTGVVLQQKTTHHYSGAGSRKSLILTHTQQGESSFIDNSYNSFTVHRSVPTMATGGTGGTSSMDPMEAKVPKVATQAWLDQARPGAMRNITLLREKLGEVVRLDPGDLTGGDDTRMKQAERLVQTAVNWGGQEEDDWKAAEASLKPLYVMKSLAEADVKGVLQIWQNLQSNMELLPRAYHLLREIEEDVMKKIKADKIMSDANLMLANAEMALLGKDFMLKIISPLEGLRRTLEAVQVTQTIKPDPDSIWASLDGMESSLTSTIEKENASVDKARQLMMRRASGTHPMVTLKNATQAASSAGPNQGSAQSQAASAPTQGAAAAPGGGPGPSQGTPSGGGSSGGTGGGGPGPGGGPWCPICFKHGHTADNCPDRPKDGKGPICALCHRRGHMFWACPQGPGAPECPTCLLKGHLKEDCPLAKVIQRRQAIKAPAHADEERLRLKLGLTPSDLETSDSDTPPPPEDPRKAMRRQLKEKRRLELNKRLEKAAKEEGRQRMRRWAEFPKIQEDILFLVAHDPQADPNTLDPDKKQQYNTAILQAYVNSLARPSRGLEAGGGVGSSLKELGIDNITLFTGEEGKYAVKPFLLKIDDIKNYKGWTDTVAAVALGQLLAGTAKDWYENQKRDRMGEPYEYTELRDDLLREFFQKITLVEKTQIMASLRFDLTKHKSHMAFLTECERKSHVIADSGFFLEAPDQLITRRQAREEAMLMYFLSGASPQMRFQIEYSKSETKEQIKAEIRKFEDALRAKSTNVRLIEPGYQVSAVSNEDLTEQLQGHGYDPVYISAVIKGRGGKAASRGAKVASADSPKTEAVCWYCSKEGHVKNECFSLKEDIRKGTVHPDQGGPKEGQGPTVETLNKGRGKGKASSSTGTKPKPARGRGRRSKKVNEVEYEEEGGEGDTEEEEESPKPSTSRRSRPQAQWGPWPQGAYPVMMPFPTQNPRALKQEDPVDVAEVSGARLGAWDLL